MQTTPIKAFTEKEHRTWSTLFARLDHCRKAQAHPLFAEGLSLLGITGEKIPDMAEVNRRLRKLTGWQGVPVVGLEEAGSFFEGLSRREFPIGNFIRDEKDISYTPAPDIFHDLYGHLPFFTDPDYANFCHEFGVRACRFAQDPVRLRQFERLFWFGVEFPLVETPRGRRIFGGGILSSFNESNYSLSEQPKILPFEVELIRNRDYNIDEMQKQIFVLKSPDQLYGCLEKY